MDLIDPTTLSLLSKALDVASLRHAVHAQNIANANVAGYAPARVSFEEHLDQVREEIAMGHPIQVATLAATLAETGPGLIHAGPNASVELDVEMAAMSANTLHYQALLKALDRQLGLVSMALADGKR